MLSLENDEMTALWPNVSYTFAVYSKFSDKIPNWAAFVKEVFRFNARFLKWQNNYFFTKWKINFPFVDTFSNNIPNWTTFEEEVFWFDA